jgi:hypothetical protein
MNGTLVKTLKMTGPISKIHYIKSVEFSQLYIERNRNEWNFLWKLSIEEN